MSTLTEVLRAHVWLNPKMWGFGVRQCDGCAWEASTSMPAVGEHADHLADAVLAWVAERAEDEVVVGAVSAQVPTPHGIHARVITRDVLTAFVGSLAGSGASAGAEVAPMAVGDLTGAQIGGYCAADETAQYGLADECPPFYCREVQR